jgi:hypothetical protein
LAIAGDPCTLVPVPSDEAIFARSIVVRSAVAANLLFVSALAIVPGVSAQEPSPPPAIEHPEEVAAPSGPTLRILPFASVDFTSRQEDSGTTGFGIGPLALYITTRISDHWSALGELVFENGDNALATDLERILVAWQASDRLRVRVGREHNPLVRWNTALHHGVYMQTPVERPAMARFEDDGGPWPVHFVGLLADGRVRAVRYGAAIGNGRGAIPDEIGVTFDRNDHKALIGWLGFSPPNVIGLDLSVTGYADRIPAEAGDVRERGWTASGSYLAGRWEVRTEYGQLIHRPEEGSERWRTTSWYVLGAVAFGGGQVKPYVMVDDLDVPAEDVFLAGIPARDSRLVGVRWDPVPRAALKAEVISERVGGGDRESAVRAQLAVSF